MLELQAQHVEAGDAGHAAVVGDLAVPVQDGNPQPGVGRLVPGRRDHRADAGPAQVKLDRASRRRERRGRIGRAGALAAAAGDVPVDGAQQPLHPRLCPADRGGQVIGEAQPPAIRRGQPPGQPHLARRQRIQADRAVAAAR